MKKLLSVVLILVLILSVTPLCYAKNTDTLADWNIRITVPDGKTAVLKGSEYYIYGQHEGSIPYVMLRPYRYDDPGKFIMDFTEYMQGQYADFTVISPATRKTIGNKRCWEIDYGYTVSEYEVRDRRVVITVDGLTYMFASKEIESNGMTIGSMLDDVVAECELLSPGADSVLVEQDYLSAYAPVFDSYLAFLNGAEPDGMDTTERGDYYYVLGETGCSEMVRSGGELGYCLKDLDRNGIPELLIGATGADYYDETLIYDMFTLENGVPVRVLVSSARVRYYLAEEDLILHEGSGGAAYSLSILYFLENGKLEIATGIVMSDTECFKVYEERESMFTDRKPSDQRITREQYYDLMDKMAGLAVPMELTPFQN